MEFAPTPPATDKADRHKQRRSAKKAERRARKARVAAAAAAAEEAAATAAAAPAVATPATTTPPAAPPRSRKRQRASTPRDIRHTEKAPVAGVTPGVKLAFQTKADQGRRITDDDLVEDWVAGSGAGWLHASIWRWGVRLGLGHSTCREQPVQHLACNVGTGTGR